MNLLSGLQHRNLIFAPLLSAASKYFLLMFKNRIPETYIILISSARLNKSFISLCDILLVVVLMKPRFFILFEKLICEVYFLMKRKPTAAVMAVAVTPERIPEILSVIIEFQSIFIIILLKHEQSSR